MNYAILKVNLRAARGVELHLDPELAKVAVYTTQPIPGSAISLG